MLLAGKLTTFLALINLTFGIAGSVLIFGDFDSWTEVFKQTPLALANPYLLTTLKVFAVIFLATGLLQVVSSFSNARLQCILSLTCQCVLLSFSIAASIFIFQNNVRSQEFLSEQMVGLYSKYNKSKATTDFLDGLHVKRKCCGYRSDHTEWLDIIGPGRVPDSCCKQQFGNSSSKKDSSSTPISNRGCGYHNQSIWLSRLHNAACPLVLWRLYEPMDPMALLFLWLWIYILWLGMLFSFHKIFLASYLAAEVAKYLSAMERLAD